MHRYIRLRLCTRARTLSLGPDCSWNLTLMQQCQSDLVYVVTDPLSVKWLLGYPLAWFAGRCWKVDVICGREDRGLTDLYPGLVHFVPMKRTISLLGDAAALLRLMRTL